MKELLIVFISILSFCNLSFSQCYELQKVPVLLLSGQSNANGQGDVTDITDPNLLGVQPNIFIWDVKNTETFVNYEAGVNSHPPSPNSGQFGVELTLAKELLNDYNVIYLVKYAAGGRGIANNPDRTDFNINTCELSCQLIDEASKARSYLAAQGKKAVFINFTWVHGENDAVGATNAALYEENLTPFEKYVEDQINLIGNTAIVQLGNCQTTLGSLNIVRSEQASFVVNDNNSLLINNDAYCNTVGDDLHYDAATLMQLGIDIYNAIDKPVISN